jgi:vacuolar-type H+-ATPase subunit I/STV1
VTNSNGNAFDRLDRIETLVEANTRAISETRASIEQLATVAGAALSIAQSNREGLQQTEQLTRRNATAIARLEERMEQYIVEGREHREFIATQVDGIKVETRRIIQHLFGEMDNE